MLLIRNATVYAPEPAGETDILTAGGIIVAVEAGIHITGQYCETFDASGLIAVPGFVDGHVHMTGGGGDQVRLMAVLRGTSLEQRL